MSLPSTCPSQFYEGFSRIAFASCWADWNDNEASEEEYTNLSGCEITGMAPPTPKEFIDLCERFCNEKLRPVWEYGESIDADLWDMGGDVAMECMGHGVAWTDDHDPHPFSYGEPRHNESPYAEDLSVFKNDKGEFQVDGTQGWFTK